MAERSKVTNQRGRLQADQSEFIRIQKHLSAGGRFRFRAAVLLHFGQEPRRSPVQDKTAFARLDTFYCRGTVAVLTQGAGVSNTPFFLTIQHCEATHSIVQRTAHRFAGRCSLSVEAADDRSVVRLAGFVDDPERLEREFRAALLDDVLRARIEAETAPLRLLIVEAALRSALRDPDADA